MYEQISKNIRERRSFYPLEYTQEEIPKEDIMEFLEDANWAPNHGLTQPWRFVVFEKEGLQTLSDVQGKVYKKNTPEEEFEEKRYEKLKKLPLLSNYVIGIIMHRGTNKKIPKQEEMLAVACAVQNIALGVSAKGYGGYWSTGGLVKFPQAKEYFGLNEEDEFMGLFYIGTISGQKKVGNRDNISDKVTWVNE
ncbi:nitroreductase [Flammeovirga yaeyamensis]|uniref:Putative NAD(P)H nitroreductase n=1 Tax=Flammeovirga yaeyamensis TaxID=367791 RepID=A0AAX1MYA5_9BACT|nr:MULTISPECIES: nitroreductase [Flammeovirga]ANQ48300.1 nitroreductase [Flammeovirga sp. MY04]MBB3696204.1 nitroreductase [Flammeovirga yaeyamensis]NMF34887.1 nitroreductase [Flammeovirga yaeyamensis]QWG00286.1 nitroreductase [Flammeovirga yaeyamensis]